MLIIRACLLWLLISVHIVGAAVLFRRLFPRESPWLGFVVPEIVAVFLCNFIEHHVALPNLRFFLPLTTIASAALIFSPKCPWRVIRLPTLIFLAVFAFTLSLRFWHPDLADTRDGVPDLGIMTNFMFGQTLPAESDWLPPIKMLNYYYLGHYAGALLIRLLGVDPGTGYNLCAALLGAYTFYLMGAAAWLLTRGKLWIVILMLVLTACATTGDAGYVWLTVKDPNPENVINPYSVGDHDGVENNWVVRLLTPIATYDRHQLTPPAYWSWMGSFHSSDLGQLVVCFTILSLLEIVRRRKSNWPWICLAVSPLLMLTTCAWGLPLIVLLVAAGLIVCWRMKIRPENLNSVLVFSMGLLVLLEPMLVYFLNWHFQQLYWATGLHTQFTEFLILWWPLFLPWLALLFIWKRLHPVVRIVLVVVPIAFVMVEIWNIGPRYDMTAKCWGMIYAAAWITFLPVVAMQRTCFFRTLLALIILASALSLGFWTTYTWHTTQGDEAVDIGHLDGLGRLRTEDTRARIMEILSHLDNQIIITGHSEGSDIENAMLAELTHNRSYTAMSRSTDDALYANGLHEGFRRYVDLTMLYAGEMDNPLLYLRQRNIAAVVIYPGDDIDPLVIDILKVGLAPYYSYEDANFQSQDQVRERLSPFRPCAGVFVYRPEIVKLLGPPQDKQNKQDNLPNPH
jgi:hypothetical protein